MTYLKILEKLINIEKIKPFDIRSKKDQQHALGYCDGIETAGRIFFNRMRCNKCSFYKEDACYNEGLRSAVNQYSSAPYTQIVEPDSFGCIYWEEKK